MQQIALAADPATFGPIAGMIATLDPTPVEPASQVGRLALIEIDATEAMIGVLMPGPTEETWEVQTLAGEVLCWSAQVRAAFRID